MRHGYQQRRTVTDWSNYIPGNSKKKIYKGEFKDGKEESKEKERAREETKAKQTGNLFDAFPLDRKATTIQEHISMGLQYKPQPGVPWYKTWRIPEQVDGRTRTLHTSHRKLNKLASQIIGKPIDYAILQMKFSEKRVSRHVERLLLETKERAQGLQMNLDELVVKEAWVGKGADMPKRIDIRARGKFGTKMRYRAHMTVRLGRGETPQEKYEKKMQRALDKIRIAEPLNNDKKIRFPRGQWAW